MKKLILCLSALIAFTISANAQTTQVSTKTMTKTSTNPSGKTSVKKKTMVKSDAGTTMTKSSVVLKKDGTPDKRYKKAKVLKKDGTPDMRYKVNQTTTVKK